MVYLPVLTTAHPSKRGSNDSEFPQTRATRRVPVGTDRADGGADSPSTTADWWGPVDAVGGGVEAHPWPASNAPEQVRGPGPATSGPGPTSSQPVPSSPPPPRSGPIGASLLSPASANRRPVGLTRSSGPNPVHEQVVSRSVSIAESCERGLVCTSTGGPVAHDHHRGGAGVTGTRAKVLGGRVGRSATSLCSIADCQYVVDAGRRFATYPRRPRLSHRGVARAYQKNERQRTFQRATANAVGFTWIDREPRWSIPH